VVVFVLMPSVFVIVMMMCHNLSKVLILRQNYAFLRATGLQKRTRVPKICQKLAQNCHLQQKWHLLNDFCPTISGETPNFAAKTKERIDDTA